ncbi:MAG TPA: GNAT family N-acetyltransferase [Gemmatimonadales bacterium]|nr:GNAT family N-acetyltransferase [Gemmatimonadales bacterium]
MIEELPRPAPERDLDGLGRLLVDAVESGAAVTFLPPLAMDRARSWWQKVLDGAPGGSAFLVAREGDRIMGTVHYQPAAAPNQPHRAEVSKLIVHRDARRQGLGTQLMIALEAKARAQGLTLLTLDTRRGDSAERLYARLGWTTAGVIPDFALNPDGSYHDTVIFYKRLR